MKLFVDVCAKALWQGRDSAKALDADRPCSEPAAGLYPHVALDGASLSLGFLIHWMGSSYLYSSTAETL